jgi:CRISPR-associated endonuclease Cas1
MRANRTPTTRGIVVARGYGLKIRVERGHLIVEDGVGRERRTRRYHRASSRIKRLVVIGNTGYISLEALRWLCDVGAALVHIDPDGGLLASSTSAGPAIPTLRRAQALAATSETGVNIARQLMREKVQGQLSLLDSLPGGEDAKPEVKRALAEIERVEDIPGVLASELRAASAYWSAWEALPVRIAPRRGSVPHTIPDHWLRFGQRASLLTGGPRAATNPYNAVLNWIYTVLSAEATIACHAVGLDPGIGIFHADRDHLPNRAALAYDVMEPVRPAVDAYVLALITQRTVRADDFGETRRGACRLSQRFAAELAGTAETWRVLVAPYVERVSHLLCAATVGRAPSSPLTSAARLAAWEDRKPWRKRQRRTPLPALPATCRDCGEELPSRSHRYCADCRKRRWEGQADRARRNAAEVLSALRAEQRDPGHRGRATQLRGSKNAAHQRAVREWTGERPDPDLFTTEILPGLRELTIARLAAATGLSGHYCSLIRLGKRVPHPRHWEALRAAASGLHAPIGSRG